jgi:hypothetical protein
MVTTTYPREARSSTSETFQSRASPAPGEYSTTGNRPSAIGAPARECVFVADQFTRPAGSSRLLSSAGPTTSATAFGNWFVVFPAHVWDAG